MTLKEKVIAAARAYIGQHEKSGNSGFVSPEFEAEMKAVGWAKGSSWCAYFAELAWKKGFEGHPLRASLDKLFSPAATATLANFKHSDQWKTGTKPQIGALAVWQYGKTWKGHIGIVTELVDSETFRAVEGNTNAQGGREGVAVLEKTRKVGLPFKNQGLNLIGFVYLPE